MSLPQFPGKHLFFTGKGGVGKTTVACSLAAQYALAGERVLLVSTDPASNVGQVFGREIGGAITALGDLLPGGVSGAVLDAIEIDPDVEVEAYRESILGPVRGLLPPEVLAGTEETLSGSCTVEVASFNRFTDFLVSEEYQSNYDRLIFDTAPTGHTLRLLSLPGDWSSFIDKGIGDASCLGPMSGLDKHKQTYQAAVAALGDENLTNLVLVARAQESSIAEANRSAAEFAKLGIPARNLIVNGLLPAGAATDELSTATHRREQALLAEVATAERFPALHATHLWPLELRANPVMGVAGLLGLGADSTLGSDTAAVQAGQGDVPVGLGTLVDALGEGHPKVVLCMGKGGVGKTTIAQALAVELAGRGLPVHLSTTDPAAHLDVDLSRDLPNLRISAIDPVEVVAAYREEVLATKGANLDPEGYAQLEEDLRSPCTEEVAVFRAFSRVIGEAEDHWVVLDTAPTGHTLLLLDATGSYHRELMRQSGQADTATTLDRLQDAEVTRPVLVTLPETTPVLESQALAADLERAGITPWAWVVNQSLPATDTDSPFLRTRAVAQTQAIHAVVEGTQAPVVQLPVQVEEPKGVDRLRALL